MWKLTLCAVIFLRPLITINGLPDDRWRLVMKAVQDALSEAHLTQKDAWMSMGLDAPRWSRICAGEDHLSVFRLARLPLKFQMAFIAHYAFTVVRHSVSEIAEDIRRRA